MCAHTRNTHLASRMEHALVSLNRSAFDDDQLIDLELSRLQLRYLQIPSGAALLETIAELRSLAERANVEHHSNSRSVRILMGLSSCLIAAARIEEALQCLPKALRASQILDSFTARASILAHISLCHGLLGQYELQYTNATLSLRDLPNNTPCYSRLLATYQLGLASARLSQEDQAHRLALDLITWDRVDTQPWLQQTALLYAADILSAVDRLADARDTSWRALMMGNGLALSRKFAGLAARLLALNLTHPQRARAASEAIERISAESCPMDVIDEVEVLDAQIRAARAVGTSDVQLVARLTTCAAALPPRLNIYFKDMGLVI